jgi:hypothetical protein
MTTVAATRPVVNAADDDLLAAPPVRILSRLSGVRQVGVTQWEAHCPCHDDRRPSLRVKEGESSIALVKCLAGCQTASVLAAIDLRMADLYPHRPAEDGPWLREHHYRDEEGRTLYKICKDTKKRWAAFRPDPASSTGWQRGIGDARRVLYRLPEVIDSIGTEPVWCCEGERDADTAASVGLIGTAAPFNKWSKVDLSSLRGRQCVVVCDRDAPGYAQGLMRAAKLRELGALVDDEDIVWPGLAHDSLVNDLTDLVDVVGTHPYDISESLRTIPDSPPERVARSIEDRAGRFAIVPNDLLTLSMTAQSVFISLDFIAGDSGLAKLTIIEFAESKRIGRNRAAAGFDELVERGLVRPEKRGWWTVLNSARSRKSGWDVDAP